MDKERLRDHIFDIDKERLADQIFDEDQERSTDQIFDVRITQRSRMSRSLSIWHGSMCISHGSSTWHRHRDRCDNDTKANTHRTHDWMKHRGRPSAAPQGERAAFGRPPQ